MSTKIEFPKAFLTFVKENKDFPTVDELSALDGLVQRFYANNGGKEAVIAAFNRQYPKLAPKPELGKKEKIVQTFIRLLKELNRNPTSQELHRQQITRAAVDHYFGNMEGLKSHVFASDKSLKSYFFTEEEFTPRRFKNLTRLVKTYKRFVISTVIAGAAVDRDFYNNIKKYCSEKDALLLLIPIADPVGGNRSLIGNKLAFDPILRDECFVYDDLQLNSNLFVSGLKLQAKHINPFTGLHRIAQTKGNFYYGSPKQSMEPVASETFPRIMLTPGAITQSNYRSDLYVSQRTDYIAEHDHMIGAHVVEVPDNKTFHFRQLQADKDGQFVDLGILYGTTAKRVNSVFSLGDLHAIVRDQSAMSAWRNVVQEVGCETVLVEDDFDGKSINYFDRYKHQKLAKETLTLEAELANLAQCLTQISSWKKGLKVVRKASNHPERLDKYLEGGEYVKDHKNSYIGHVLWLEKYKGKDPIQAYLQQVGINLPFIDRRSSFVYGGFELGKHGDKGQNGAKGNLQSHKKSYAKSVTGHSHSPSQYNFTLVNGTSGPLREDYTEGPSSWLHASTLIYETGHAQTIISINGKWRIQ